jgi:hypothetical protein
MRRAVVGILVVALVADWMVFQSGYFAYPVGHDIGMSPTDPGADSALILAIPLMIAIVIIGLWPRCVARYERVWS